MTTPLQHTSLGELGGYNPLLSTSLGELGGDVPVEPPFTPEPVHPPGVGRRRKQILEEDEMIMAIITAFLETRK
jgi:hypothetical protein